MTPLVLEDVLPHRGAAILLDEASIGDDGSATCIVRITAHSRFATPSGVPAVVCLEYMAQAVAVQASVAVGGIHGGWLAGCPELELFVDAFALGDVLRVQARPSTPPGHTFGAIRAFFCTVHREESLLARASLFVYEPPT